MQKKISVLIPCYNEEENVIPMSEAVREQFQKHLPNYDWELIFIDNDSSDATRENPFLHILTLTLITNYLLIIHILF